MRPAAISDLAATSDERVMALAFLETKLYDHPMWPAFISRRGEELLKNADKAWDADWLREVHLFMVVCSDAERASALIPRINRGISVDQFFSTLAGRSDNTVLRLIQNYQSRTR